MEKLREPIIVGVNHEPSGDNWVLAPPSANVIRLARQITDGDVIAVAIVPRPDVGALGSLGVKEVYVPAGSKGARSVPALGADTIAAVADTLAADLGAVLLPSNYWGKEITARLAVRLDGGGAVDVTSVAVEDGQLVGTKSALGGSWVTRFTVQDGLPILSVNPGDLHTRTAPSQVETVVVPIDVPASPETAGVSVINSRRDVGDASELLTEADVAVVGGRGVEGDFDMVRDLAAQMDGAVGATRVACDEGWIDRTAQVGQTGVSISPRVYVGLGVSGAIHHTCSMQGSEIIVAVCDDPDAPIFEIADFGIVGDVAEIVPQAIELLQEMRG